MKPLILAPDAYLRSHTAGFDGPAQGPHALQRVVCNITQPMVHRTLCKTTIPARHGAQPSCTEGRDAL